jgi:hypothetical protein
MALALVTSTDQNVIAPLRHHDQVISDESMSPLDEVEDTFTFSDPAFSHEQESHSVHIREGSVYRR